METGAEDKNQQTAIYVMTHKAFTPPPDPLYIPLHVGRAAASSYSRDEKSSPLSFCVGDNTGDHISEKNCYYSELTGMYWVWKNSHAKVVGTCHYRRYLLNEQGKLFTEAQILSLLRQYDVITTKELQLNFSYYEGFASHHKILYLDETARVIQEIYPDYAADFQQLIYVLCLLILLFSHCCHSLIRSVDAQYFIMDFSCLSLVNLAPFQKPLSL